MAYSDCGAVQPEEECGECTACEERESEGVNRDLEAGTITYAQALDQRGNNTWGR